MSGARAGRAADELLGHGRTSQVYAYGPGTAIKVYPPGRQGPIAPTEHGLEGPHYRARAKRRAA